MNYNLLEALKSSKLDLTDLYLEPIMGSNDNNKKEFDISPTDFLRFAKEDLKQNDERGYINSITNSKRAIDCQIDAVLVKLAFRYDNFSPLVSEFLKHFEFELDIPIKLKIIHSLNLAPSLIISKSRNLRNKLEHIYQKPNIQEVKEALDVADLFLRSVVGKFNMMCTHFEIVDGKDSIRIRFEFSFLERHFKLTVLRNFESVNEYYINSNDLEYWGILRLMFSIDDDVELEKTLKILLKQISHPMPLDKVKIVFGF